MVAINVTSHYVLGTPYVSSGSSLATVFGSYNYVTTKELGSVLK